MAGETQFENNDINSKKIVQKLFRKSSKVKCVLGKPAVRRLARQGGLKLFSTLIYNPDNVFIIYLQHFYLLFSIILL